MISRMRQLNLPFRKSLCSKAVTVVVMTKHSMRAVKGRVFIYISRPAHVIRSLTASQSKADWLKGAAKCASDC